VLALKWGDVLKIGLNATCFNDRPSGAKQRFVGIYGELVKRLPDTEFVIYEPVDCQVSAWFDGAPNVSARITPLPSQGRVRKFFGGLKYWDSALALDRFDIFEGLSLPLVKSATGKILLTIHDIRQLQQEYGALERAVYKAFLSRALRVADHVITVSEAMKEEILNFYPSTRISVIYNGLDAGVFDQVSESDMLAVRRKFDLSAEFIMAVGHFEKRKNYLTLIDAVERLRDRGSSCNLLIVGNDSGGKQEIQERIESAKLSGSVKLLSALTDLEVRCLYKLCRLFVFPSAYEGFGIPILEAMAAGCPMVLSDIPVFREITQDRGIYFPPQDVESLACEMERVLSSESECARLVEYGNNRVKDFSFKSLAAQMECLYKSVM